MQRKSDRLRFKPKDCKAVIALLEEHEILATQYLRSTRKVAPGVIVKEYEKTILNERVIAYFIEFPETKEFFFKRCLDHHQMKNHNLEKLIQEESWSLIINQFTPEEILKSLDFKMQCF